MLTTRDALNLPILEHPRKLKHWYSFYFCRRISFISSYWKLYLNLHLVAAAGHNNWCQINEGYSILDGSRSYSSEWSQLVSRKHISVAVILTAPNYVMLSSLVIIRYQQKVELNLESSYLGDKKNSADSYFSLAYIISKASLVQTKNGHFHV